MNASGTSQNRRGDSELAANVHLCITAISQRGELAGMIGPTEAASAVVWPVRQM